MMVENLTQGQRFSAADIAQAIEASGERLVDPPIDPWKYAVIEQSADDLKWYRVWAPLWNERGLSKLELELLIRDDYPYIQKRIEAIHLSGGTSL